MTGGMPMHCATWCATMPPSILRTSRQWRRAAGLCVGFVPVLSMALHNWIYGHVFVPLSANAAHPDVLVMPPSAYAQASRELFTLNFSGGYLLRALLQIPRWLSGPAESYATAPLNAGGVAVLLYVLIRGRGFDPWLRLIAAAALAQHAVALWRHVLEPQIDLRGLAAAAARPQTVHQHARTILRHRVVIDPLEAYHAHAVPDRVADALVYIGARRSALQRDGAAGQD